MDWSRLDGLWYETHHDWGNSLEWFWSCTTEAYYKSEFNSDVYRISTPYRIWPFELKWAENAQLYCKDGGDGNCIVSMWPWGQVDTTGSPNFFITGTDYDNYIVVYSCMDGYIANLQNVWIMTRTNKPSEEVLQKVRDSLAATIGDNWALNGWDF